MNQGPSQEQSLKEWIDLFSDPASSLSSLDKGNLSESAFSSSLYSALWLEFFLIAGEKAVKEKWASLSFEEQIGLGIELLKCYLFQPLYIRLSKEKKSSVKKPPLRLESQGKFFRVEQGTGTNRKIELLYPLDHLRFWPDLFRLFQEDFLSSEKVLKALEPGIILGSSSHLEKIRQRAETLSSFLKKKEREEMACPSNPEEQPKPENISISPGGETPSQTTEAVPTTHRIETAESTPLEKNSDPIPSTTLTKKKNWKPSKDQMELF